MNRLTPMVEGLGNDLERIAGASFLEKPQLAIKLAERQQEVLLEMAAQLDALSDGGANASPEV